MSDPDFDGCRRACRLAATHTLIWGDCENAPESSKPKPKVTFVRNGIAEDGQPSLWCESLTTTELAARIDPVLRHAWAQPHASLAAVARAIAEDLAAGASTDVVSAPSEPPPYSSALLRP